MVLNSFCVSEYIFKPLNLNIWIELIEEYLYVVFAYEYLVFLLYYYNTVVYYIYAVFVI